MRFLSKIIWLSFLALSIITPIIFTTQTSELYEVPKMLFVYFSATVIFFSTIIKFVLTRKVVIPKLGALAALILFIAIQVISTFTSIDKFTSVFGYPTRLNGGLLSQFAYLSLFFCALVNLDKLKSQKLIATIVLTAFAVSLWGIPGHFDKDPSCYVLTGRLTSGCWQQEFNPLVRIFSTLGQPNWLAQYLVLVMPFSLVLTFIDKKSKLKFFWALATIAIFVAFLFTNSRSGLLGFILSLIILTALLGTEFIKERRKIFYALSLVILFLLIIFGATLLGRVKEVITLGHQPSTINQPTESSSIRLIVWQGAWQVFLNNPILGTGPETFAYSYYKYRPLTHNQTTEWNFFYNKAHNEFLNYLANIGVLGLSAYLIFIFFSLKAIYQIAKSASVENQLFAKAAIASLVGYQTVIFFGFSIVVSQLLMFLIIPIIFTIKDINTLEFSLNFLNGLTKKVAGAVILLAGLWTLTLIARLYFADATFSRAQRDENANSLLAYNNAVDIFPVKNPQYIAGFAYTASLYASGIDDKQLSSALKKESLASAALALKLSPNNLLIVRKVANTYLLLADIDQNSKNQALTVAQKLPQLAPTDPQSFFTLGKVQSALGDKQKAKESLEHALALKPNYQEAKDLLDQIETLKVQ